MNAIAWTKRTETLLLALTLKVRFLALNQIARAWWTETELGKAAAYGHLQRLRKAGYVEWRAVTTHPELPLTAPLFSWQPGEPPPDCERLAYACQSRWTETLVRQTVWLATEKTAHALGGGSGWIIPAQATHDLHVGALFCHGLRENPEFADAWIPEHHLPATPHARRPDALLVGPKGDIRQAIEFGGAAKAKRIEKLHAWATHNQEVPYALW